MTRILINRLILWLALAGMILALHLWIQKARGFDQGCLGLNTHPIATESGCHLVGELPGSHLVGVSNAAWGYAFYFALALVSFVKLAAGAWSARRLHMVGELLVAFALLYSAYLVYQMGFVAHAWCVLCLVSAMLVALLAALHAGLRWRGGFEPGDEAGRAGEFRAGVSAIFGATGVLVGVLVFVDRLGTRPLDQGSTRKELAQVVGETLPIYIAAEKLREMRACHFDWDAPTLVPGAFTNASTPFIGNSNGPEVIVFYDPNCPHCKDYDPEFRRVIGKWKDRARFTMLPRLLWDFSIPQAEALKLAEDRGKYFELWSRMFAAHTPGKQGMTLDEITSMFRDLGLDTAGLETRLAEVRPQVDAARRQAQAAGIDAVPAVYIGGRKVWSMNGSEDCLGTLLERVLTGGVKSVLGEKK